jgi:hypothetical protein
LRTELASGAWVEHRPLTDLKFRDKDTLGLVMAGNLPGGVEPGQDPKTVSPLMHARMNRIARDATWALVLTDWSFDLPLPVVADGELINAASIGDLDPDDGIELVGLFAPFVAKLLRQPDPKGGRTATSSSSNGSSRARAAHSPKG